MPHAHTRSHGRVSIMSVGGTLLCPLPSELTDADTRALRDDIGRALRARSVGGVIVDVSAVETIDSYITRCIRDVAVGARLMGAQTIVCGVRVEVADTLVEMGLTMDGVRTARSVEHALSMLRGSQRSGR